MSVVLAGLVALASLPQAGAVEFQGTMRKIKDTGVIALGFRENVVPFAYLNEKKEPAGYSVDLCLKIVDEVKNELRMPNLRVRFVPDNPQTRIPLLANGTTDMECGILTNTLERHRQIDFTLTTFITGARMLTRRDSGIKEPEDLAGKSLGVAPGTIEERFILDLIKAEHIANVKYLNVKDLPEAVLALLNNRIDAFVSDDAQVHALLSKRQDLKAKLEIVGRQIGYEPIALPIRRNDADFALAANTALVRLFRSGEILQIYNKWFGPLDMPATDLLKTAFKLEALP